MKKEEKMGEREFTEQTEKVFRTAKREAQNMNHAKVTSGHIFLAMLLEGDGVAGVILKNFGFKAALVRYILKALVHESANSQKDDIPWSGAAEEISSLAPGISRQLNHSYIGTEHLLLAALWDISHLQFYNLHCIFEAFEIDPQKVKDEATASSGLDIEKSMEVLTPQC